MGGRGGGCVMCVTWPRARPALLLHRGQRHKSETIDFPPCWEAGNCHVESADLGRHAKTTIPPGPPSAPIGEDARQQRQATNKELLNLWRRKRQEVSWRRKEGKRERELSGKKMKGWGRANSQSQGQFPRVVSGQPSVWLSRCLK